MPESLSVTRVYQFDTTILWSEVPCSCYVVLCRVLLVLTMNGKTNDDSRVKLVDIHYQMKCHFQYHRSGDERSYLC